MDRIFGVRAAGTGDLVRVRREGFPWEFALLIREHLHGPGSRSNILERGFTVLTDQGMKSYFMLTQKNMDANDTIVWCRRD